jgi:hypothetical protein
VRASDPFALEAIAAQGFAFNDAAPNLMEYQKK